MPALNPGLNIDFSTLELPYKHTVYQVNTRKKCKVIVEKMSPNTIGKYQLFNINYVNYANFNYCVNNFPSAKHISLVLNMIASAKH